jgi:ABC-2 type transport system permease protein
VGNLAWLTVAAEDAPELIGAAPVKLASIRWMKILAAAAPVWVLLSPIVVFLAITSPLAAAVLVLCLAGATLSAGLMQIWYPQRGKRSDLKRRMQSSRLITILEILTGLAWTGTAYLLLSAPLYAIFAAPFVLIGPGAAWVLGEARRKGDMTL